jgi:hypothetical protein
MTRITARITLIRFAFIFFVLAAIFMTSCVRVSDGTWYVREAALPAGWPALTPVGEVQIKTYPEYREAVVREADLEGVAGADSMFMELFDHIRDRDIPMTAPVDMGYARAEGENGPAVSTMAFLYRSPELGPQGADDTVTVRDLPARTYVSIGVRGTYTDERFADNLAVLDAWLMEHASEWLADGAPRYLGYNGPFTLGFMKYGEVQAPVRQAAEAPAGE